MKKYIVAKCLILFLIIIFTSNVAYATNVYFETSKNTVSVGDTFIVKVKIDAENKDINTVEGDIVLTSQNNNFVVNDPVIAESPFTLWPQNPSLSEDGKTISFVGGVPGGFNSDKINLFNIIVKTNKEGDIEFSPKNIVAFANDGQGTKLPVNVRNLIVKVIPLDAGGVISNEWVDLINQDKESPSIPLITIGRDATLFNGKTFAFFTATDDQSGISYYEVSEDGEPAVRSGNMYVLNNQDDAPDLVVTVYDKAGNKNTVVYNASGFTILGFPLNFLTVLVAILIILIVLFFLFVLILRIKNKRKRR